MSRGFETPWNGGLRRGLCHPCRHPMAVSERDRAHAANTAPSISATYQSKPPAPNTTASNLSVLSAIYGDNCPFNPDDKGQVDVTALMAEFCKKEPPGLCRYPIQKRVLGDPSKGCAKSFRVRYACRRRGPSALHGKRTSCRQPKNGSVYRSSGEQPPATVQLNCPPPQVYSILG
jgi:hypothetical protein